MSARPAILGDDQHIILAGGFTEGPAVRLVANSDVSNLPDLFSSHEETNTHMVLHAINLSSTFEWIVVRSDDTDVLVLLLYYSSKGKLDSSVYMHARH